MHTPTTLHVAPHGDDTADGSAYRPLKTISAAAHRAQPGTTIRIHSGLYRERIDPPRGGTSPDQRIVYEAAGDGPVEIRGSEIVTGWTRVAKEVWTVRIPDAFFGGFHPFREPLRGHWFAANGRIHHAGSVYAGEDWLLEAATREELGAPSTGVPRWFCHHDGEATTFWAEFPGRDPNDGSVEVSARQTVFYPSREGCDYITIRGLTLSRAATPWSPPTTEQIGLLGTHWSKGWIIEHNRIRHSCCAGITLGKYHDPEDRADLDILEGTSGADLYNGTIQRALVHGWSPSRVGGHVVRDNIITHCEQAGICGSLGAIRCLIEGNVLHDIHVRRQFGGYEQAGIKFHGAIDTVIARNHIHHCNRGIWLDWMTQGTRVTANLFHDNGPDVDLFIEVNHGPFLVDHNILLSHRTLDSWSEGGAYVRNLFLGRVSARAERERRTPYHPPHRTEVVGIEPIGLGDDRFLGNIFIHADSLADYPPETPAMTVRGNLYLGDAVPSPHDQDPRRDPTFAAALRCELRQDGAYLVAAQSWSGTTNAPSDTTALTPPRLVGAPYEDADGAPVDLGCGYDGGPHSSDSSGPFSFTPTFPLKVWPQVTKA